MHSLVVRQLKRYFKDEVPTDARFQLFLQAVSDAYDAENEDRALLERTMELLSKETQERYESLQLDIQQREKAENERDAFFRASSDMLTIVSDALEIIQASPSWERTLGYPPAEMP